MILKRKVPRSEHHEYFEKLKGGELELSYLALQCVGFNEPLYNELLRQREGELKRKAEEPEQSSRSKKKKIMSTDFDWSAFL